MEKLRLSFLLLLVSMVGAFAQASRTPAPTPPPGAVSPAPAAGPRDYELPYRYRAAIEPRAAEGQKYVAVFGGVNVYNESDGGTVNVDGLVPAPGLGDFNYNDGFTRGRLTAGIKAGVLFPMSDPADTDPVRFSLGGEVEAFYNNFKASGNVDADLPANGSLRTKLEGDAAVFMVNGIGRMEYSILRPYIGLGIGMAVITADSTIRLNQPPAAPQSFSDDDIDVVLAAQGLAGLEFKLAERWGLFTEYRHLVFFDSEFTQGGYTVSWDNIQQGIVTGGVKYYY